ncbi:MAG: alpha/beta hydrolase [Candidatus Omnitrophica bacterium]|nr:alpha/beta hydrolase [Candidatus Omnitrophota bacterium]
MTLPRSEERKQVQFQFISRGFPETILLLPGWAADHRIFGPLGLEFNYLLPSGSFIQDFEKALLENLEKRSLRTIAILGSSMGGFLAADFAVRHPERVKSLTLMGMRKRYEEAGIEKIKEYLKTSKAAYLYKFYHPCFSPGEGEYLSLFKKGLMKRYLKEFSTDELLEGLDYLAGARLDPDALRDVKARFIHGDSDKIAPIEEMAGINGLTVLKGAGHFPFLRTDFREVFYDNKA